MKVCTGAKSEDNSKLAARKYARIIQKLGFEAKFTDFKIQVCARFFLAADIYIDGTD